MTTDAIDRPIRAAVFHEPNLAEHVVQELVESGFSEDQITVVCSDRITEARFRRYEHQEPAGYYWRGAVTGGTLTGAILGGSVGVIVMIASGSGWGLLGVASLCTLTGGIAGAFLGEMATRGVEKELANYYEEAVQPGDILVAAEDHSQRAAKSLEEAEHIFEHAGARPITLSEG